MKAAVVTHNHKVNVEDKELRNLKPGEAFSSNRILWCMSHRFTR